MRTTPTIRICAFALASTLVMTACGRDDAAPRVPLGSVGASASSSAPTPLREALDRGNAAYRARDYEGALRAYREAAAANPDNVAPYYGIQMAARALGNAALADSALRRIRQMSGDSASADPHALPGDHPRIKVSEDVPPKPRS